MTSGWFVAGCALLVVALALAVGGVALAVYGGPMVFVLVGCANAAWWGYHAARLAVMLWDEAR